MTSDEQGPIEMTASGAVSESIRFEYEYAGVDGVGADALLAAVKRAGDQGWRVVQVLTGDGPGARILLVERQVRG